MQVPASVVSHLWKHWNFDDLFMAKILDARKWYGDFDWQTFSCLGSIFWTYQDNPGWTCRPLTFTQKLCGEFVKYLYFSMTNHHQSESTWTQQYKRPDHQWAVAKFCAIYAMDDLSINISGIAPAAARTAAALSKKSLNQTAEKASPKAGKNKQQKVLKGPKGPKGPKTAKETKAEAVSVDYASKVKDWRKNRFQKDVDTDSVSKGTGDILKASKKQKKNLKPPKSETIGKRKSPDTTPAKSVEIAKGKRNTKSPGDSKASKKQKTGGSTKGRAEKLQGGIISEMKFQSLKLHESLRRQLEYLNFTDCTPIQSLAVPRALTGKRDVMLRAPTGSGKTLAFLLPVVHQLLAVPGGVDRRTGSREACVLCMSDVLVGILLVFLNSTRKILENKSQDESRPKSTPVKSDKMIYSVWRLQVETI